jgi:phage terminase small subunit
MVASDDAPDPAAPLAAGASEPPARLSARAAAEWRHLVPAATALGTLAEADLRAFELLAETLATEAEMRAVVEREG